MSVTQVLAGLADLAKLGFGGIAIAFGWMSFQLIRDVVAKNGKVDPSVLGDLKSHRNFSLAMFAVAGLLTIVDLVVRARMIDESLQGAALSNCRSEVLEVEALAARPAGGDSANLREQAIRVSSACESLLEDLETATR